MRVFHAEQVSQGYRAGLAAQRGVERAGLEGQLCPPGLAQRVAADSQVPGEVGLRRRPAQVLGQRPGVRADLQDQFLHGARDVDRPPLVPEVLLDLPADARPREGRQAARSAAGSKLPIAFSSPTYPTWIRSSAASGLREYRRAHERTRWP